MKLYKKSILYYLSVIFSLSIFNPVNALAGVVSGPDILLQEEEDSTESICIYEPVVSGYVPNSLKKVEGISDESGVINNQTVLSNALSLEPVRMLKAASTDGDEYSVGQIRVDQSVSPSGGRIYNIPIPVAAGWSAAPQISLYYNSQSGKGVAGYGWEIAGLSSIEIRNSNYYYDGQIQRAVYDWKDVDFSLDGVPIVCAEEGNMGEFFHATAKGRLRIQKHYTTYGIWTHFTVLYPDGSKGTFGFPDNTESRTTYPLTKLEDINGNVITFDYEVFNNHYHIRSINYGNDAKLVFWYGGRTEDIIVKYKAGFMDLYPSHLVSSIISYDGDTEICRYELKYEYKDEVSLLREINCISDGASYRPLSFTYGVDTDHNTEDTFVRKGQNYFVKYFKQTDDVDITYKRGKFLPGGFNDGIIMLPNYENYGQVDSKLYWFNKEYKYGSLYNKNQTILCNLSAIEHSYQFELKAGEGFQLIEAVDVNGDGVDELVKINNGCTAKEKTDFKICIYSFDRNGTASCDSMFFSVNDGTYNPCYNNPAKCDYYFGNFRGNGKKMLLITTRKKSKFVLVDLDKKLKVSEETLYTMNDEVAGLTLAADFENDGRDDLCRITDSGMDIYNISSENGIKFTKRITYSGISKSLLYYDPNCLTNGKPSSMPGTPFLLDINGDGYLDIAYAPYFNVKVDGKTVSSPTWNIFVFDGRSFRKHSAILHNRQSGDKIVFMDVDKDGLPDMLHYQKSGIYFVPNVRGGFLSPQNRRVAISTENNAELVPCNISVHGYLYGDIMTVAGPYINVYAYGKNHSTNRLLTKFTDSFGVRYNNIYGDISHNDGSYLTDFARTYNSKSGFMRQRIPLSVLLGANNVSQGNDIVSNEFYTYYDAVFNTRGLGFCGFGKIRSMDYKNGYVTISEQDPEKMGVQTHISRALRDSGNSPFEETVNTFDDNLMHYKLNPRLIKSEQIDRLSGVITATEITYDDYDYPTLTKTTKSSGNKIKYTEKTSAAYEHSISEEKYVLGVVKEKSVIRKNNNTTSDMSWKEKTVITYDDCCRPVTKKDYVGNFGSILKPVRPLEGVGEYMETQGVDRALIHRDSTAIPIPGYDATNLVAETEWEYDSHGNIISEKKALYGADTFTGSTYIYDDAGRYIVSSTNPLGQTSIYSAYNKFGKPASVTDHRGRMTSYTYDEWGNLIKSVHPDGTVEEKIVDWGGQGLYTVTSAVSGKPCTVVHYDALGREVRTGVQRFNGQWQYVDKIYDSKGRLQKESLPFRGTSATYWNEIEYDSYDRKVRLTEASGRLSTWAYNGTSVSSSMNGIESVRTYDVNGNLISVSDAGGIVTYTLRNDGQPSKVSVTGGSYTEFGYDKYGRRTKIVDPSAGTQTDNTVYNSDGSSVVTHTNPNGSIITYADRYGRTTKVERPGEYTTDYVYNSEGLLISEVSSNGTSKSYTYDDFDRVATLTETVPDGKWLKKTFTYTSGSNVSTVTYESQDGAIATEDFSYSNGTNVRIGLQDTPIRLINDENEFGRPTSVSTGDITRTYSYNAYGLPTGRTMGEVMDCSYSFDLLKGNLLSRTDNLRNHTETFGYDALNRLVSIGDRVITYSDNGNITSMDSVGEMSYSNSSKPYQLTSLTLEDDVVPSCVQNISYTCYSRPSIMTEGGRSAAFTYNGDGARVKMNVSDGAVSVLSRYYIGNQYELDVTPGGVVERLYLGGDVYSAPAVYVKEGSGPWTFYNIGRDYLGNITHIATKDGTLVEENSYDPWGRLRNPETLEIYAPGTEPELMLGRGYTGHEHLTRFGLINMNARLYDPVLGRFLSPDPYVQMPDFTQNFNRYAYGLNNPLVYVDENGEFITALIIGVCVGAALGIAAGVYEGVQIADRKGLEGSARTWTIIGGGLIGGLAGGLAGVAGAYVGAGVAAAGVGGFYAGAITGAASGATAGFINGFGMGTLETGNVWHGFKQGAVQGVIGSLTGAAVGGLIQGTTSAIKGNNFWDGSSKVSIPNSTNLTPYEKGQQGVERAIEEVRANGGDILGKEVTIKVNGTKVRVDFVAKINDKITFFEVKNGLHAGFTPNQKLVYPDLLLNKPIVHPVGANAMKIFGKPINNYNFVIIKYY